MSNGYYAGSSALVASTASPVPGDVPAVSRRDAGIHVLKYGSSILANPSAYRHVAEEIEREVGGGAKVVVVVSAMGSTTDALLACARAVTSSPPEGLVGALLATGEEASVALLAIALATAGVSALALPSWRLPIHTRGTLIDADPVDVDGDTIVAALKSHDAVVLPGFVGLDATGVPSLLGRGGSDLTALFLGHALRASEVRLVKDVNGIFPADPKRVAGIAPLPRATWDEARRVGGGVVQDKAIDYARRNGLGFRVASLGGRGTRVDGRPVPVSVSTPAGIRKFCP